MGPTLRRTEMVEEYEAVLAVQVGVLHREVYCSLEELERTCYIVCKVEQ